MIHRFTLTGFASAAVASLVVLTVGKAQGDPVASPPAPPSLMVQSIQAEPKLDSLTPGTMVVKRSDGSYDVVRPVAGTPGGAQTFLDLIKRAQTVTPPVPPAQPLPLQAPLSKNPCIH